MPRPLVYGNGQFLIAFDRRHQARDLFWPNVGYPNHLLGHFMRVGVWCDGEFSWCDSDDWDLHQDYEPRTLVGDSVWRCWKLGLEIDVSEAVHPDDPVFTRAFCVRDLRGAARYVRLFFTQNFILGQSDVGNTAFYDPFSDAVITYRGPVVVLATARTLSHGIYEYATGIKGFGGLEGTWRDAEDGALSGNPIAQGSVDSTFSISMELAPQGESVATFVLTIGDRLDRATELLAKYLELGLHTIAEDTRSDTTKWLDACDTPDLSQLSLGVQNLYWQSLLLIRSQIDNGGAVNAANDSDILETNRATYSYCWPRDGALVCMTLARLGKKEYSDRFAMFCNRIMPHDRPFLMQKYRSDGSLGAGWHPWVVDGKPEVPFQEDETALAILALEKCSEPLQSELWKTFGKRAADFLLAHRSKDGLPLPSYDLWEERRGVHFYTVCSVIAALRAASGFSGKSGSKYLDGSIQMVKSAEVAFYDDQLGRYTRMVKPFGESYERDLTPDSAIVGGLLLLQDGELTHGAESVAILASDLTVLSNIGGLARYASDYYFRKTDRFPGNPWVISTMWLARYHARAGDVDKAISLLEWAVIRAEASGVLAEQYHPETGDPLSVSPLTWSHAEFVEAALDVLGAMKR